MVDPTNTSDGPAFYTVREAAGILRCDPATLYRAIRDDGFPVVRLRSRYVVPARALEQIIQETVDTGAEREFRRIQGS